MKQLTRKAKRFLRGSARSRTARFGVAVIAIGAALEYLTTNSEAVRAVTERYGPEGVALLGLLVVVFRAITTAPMLPPEE